MRKLSLSLALLGLGAVSCMSQPPRSTDIHIEAETGELAGTAVMTDGGGFTGAGYVGKFEAQNATVRFHVAARAGIYEVKIRYKAPSEKGYDLSVNGKKASGMFAASPERFSVASAGKVELKEGDNILSIERGWGYYQIDALDLTPASAPAPLKKIAPRLADPQATPKARALMASILSRYGSQTLSGQQNVGDVKYIEETTKLSPAIVSLDLIDYSPSRVAHGSKPEGMAEEMINQYKSGHILSVMWHWNAPKDLIDKKYKDAQGKDVDRSWHLGFYTNSTTFDVQKALSDPSSEDYKLLLSDIDAIAVQLKKLQAADIPVLWRPLHEAEGGWFWWGAKGPEPFKKLWRLMHARLTEHHGLHNLIWVFTAGGKKDWYPGDDVVDLIGADAYPSDVADPLSSLWEDLLKQYDGRKPLALTEFGGVPDVDRMARFGVRWAYFASWGSELGPKKVSKEELNRLYREKKVINKP